MIITKDILDPEELLQTVKSLPPLPKTTTSIISIVREPSFDVKDLITMVSLDPPLTAGLLRIANSARSAVGRPATSVADAVLRLGAGTVLAMAMGMACRPKAKIDLGPFGISVDQYWRHCVGSVAAAEELTFRRLAKFGSSFSCAALLHDFGKLILVNHITSDRLERMADFHRTHPGYCPIDAERAILGVDHAAVGAIVARSWQLPENMIAAIEHHHDPSEWKNDLGNGVILANQIAHENEGRDQYSADGAEIVADAMVALGVDEATYESVASASKKRFVSLIEMFAV